MAKLLKVLTQIISISCLEDIHVFGLVNLLKIPIIVLEDKLVYGSLQKRSNKFDEPIQQNEISGIYVPFLMDDPHKPEHIQPLFIAYQTNHFAALIAEEHSQIYRVPIVDSSAKLLIYEL